MSINICSVRTVGGNGEMRIDQMVTDILLQSYELGSSRLRLFLRWLEHHSSAMRKSEVSLLAMRASDKASTYDALKKALKMWFAYLPESGWFWEYQLILREIYWWRLLDESSLVRMLRDDED